jgi:hypothetical protein
MTLSKGLSFHKALGVNLLAPFCVCAKHVRQLGDESSLSNLMEVKD